MVHVIKNLDGDKPTGWWDQHIAAKIDEIIDHINDMEGVRAGAASAHREELAIERAKVAELEKDLARTAS